MALEAKTRRQGWLWKPKRDDSDGSGSLNEMIEMAQEAYQDDSNGSGSLNKMTVMALEAKTR